MREREPGSDDDVVEYPIDPNTGDPLIPMGEALQMVSIGLLAIQKYQPSATRNAVMEGDWTAGLFDSDLVLSALEEAEENMTALRVGAMRSLIKLRKIGIDMPSDYERLRIFEEGLESVREAICQQKAWRP